MKFVDFVLGPIKPDLFSKSLLFLVTCGGLVKHRLELLQAERHVVIRAFYCLI
jgi:hypothetical protein